MKSNIHLILFFPAFLLYSGSLFPQLPRHSGSLGILLTLTPKSIQRALNISEGCPLMIQTVFPNYTGSFLGDKPGGIILRINEIPVNSGPEILSVEKPLIGGNSGTLQVMRNETRTEFTGLVVPKPLEISATHEIIYDQFAIIQGQSRPIINKPADNSGKKFPAILNIIIQEYSCHNMDNFSPLHPYRKVVYGFADLGYVVMCAEKPELGVSGGTPECFEIDFKREATAFAAAYDKLKSLPYVDTPNVFVFGHSLGGITATDVTILREPRCLINFGITVKNWDEYLTEMRRIRNIAFVYSYRQSCKDQKLYEKILYELVLLKKVRSILSKEMPEMEPLIKRDFLHSGNDYFLIPHESFSQCLIDVDFYHEWPGVRCRVLSIQDEYDQQAPDNYSHKEVVNIVNHCHQGNPRYLLAEMTDHNLIRINSMRECFALTRTG